MRAFTLRAESINVSYYFVGSCDHQSIMCLLLLNLQLLTPNEVFRVEIMTTQRLLCRTMLLGWIQCLAFLSMSV